MPRNSALPQGQNPRGSIGSTRRRLQEKKGGKRGQIYFSVRWRRLSRGASPKNKSVPFAGGLMTRYRRRWVMEYKDYYATLGVPRNADAKQIRDAYRKLARKYHPDVRPGDKAAEA